MNFLAHIFLSGESEKIQIGNFIADSVKGSQIQQFEPEIRLGIEMHREIDQFTDQHPVVLKSTERLKITQQRYAPVVVDIFYDHFLALYWQDYHLLPLIDFTTSFYQVTEKYLEILPAEIQKMLPYMQKDNWLYNYQTINGMKRVFEGMASRTKFNSNMLTAPEDLQNDYEFYQQEFKMYFPDVQAFCKIFLEIQNKK
jgi:acyl carrier protein phosphodiesterase